MVPCCRSGAFVDFYGLNWLLLSLQSIHYNRLPNQGIICSFSMILLRYENLLSVSIYISSMRFHLRYYEISLDSFFVWIEYRVYIQMTGKKLSKKPALTRLIQSEKWNANNISSELFLKWKLLFLRFEEPGTHDGLVITIEKILFVCKQRQWKTWKYSAIVDVNRKCCFGVKFVNFFFHFQCYKSVDIFICVGVIWKIQYNAQWIEVLLIHQCNFGPQLKCMNHSIQCSNGLQQIWKK